ncbi:hypothetical protein [Sphingobium sp. LMA1-1-1.1]|uniref:hypothetical protein n=1 Tax=Sphingobium sp. LMA1-1-1.1 TaxID=3135238 RepID=UPI003416942F
MGNDDKANGFSLPFRANTLIRGFDLGLAGIPAPVPAERRLLDQEAVQIKWKISSRRSRHVDRP